MSYKKDTKQKGGFTKIAIGHASPEDRLGQILWEHDGKGNNELNSW